SKTLHESGYLEKLGTKSQKMNVYYYSLYADKIYLDLNKDGDLEVCPLLDGDRRYKGLTCAEADDIIKYEKTIKSRQIASDIVKFDKCQKETQEDVEVARDITKRKRAEANLSKGAMKTGMPQEREQEKRALVNHDRALSKISQNVETALVANCESPSGRHTNDRQEDFRRVKEMIKVGKKI
ncbi:MAG: hypothetical protein P4N59_21130, partial [Negativicutes bacterium]|nr:hypothetical protein [Negativicutes bacterium]